MAKVLVVDDVPDNVKLLSYELEDHGHEVLVASGGVMALSLARDERPDVILLDVMMPDMDGIETCRRLKQDPETESIPVIMVSARGQEDDVMRGLEAGAQDYVTKPFNSQIVAARVRTAVRSKAAHDELETRVRGRTAELTGANAALRESEQRYRFLADAMPQIVWGTRPDGSNDYFNRRWHDYTGLDFQAASGWGWQSVLHPDDLPACLDRWQRSLKTGEPYEVEYRLRRAADGMFRWHLGRGLPMRDESGEIDHWIGTCTDIDDQKRAEEALRLAYDEMESRVRERTAELALANESLQGEVAERSRAEREALKAREVAEAATRAKGEFLANMSHEIRTPMNGILGMTELALGTPLDPRQREYLGLAKSSAEALLTVIDDILDFSKIEAGKLDLDPVPFRLRDLLADTLGVLAHRAHAKQLELACRIAPDAPDALIGDPGRLRQVIVNLVGNAIKFTGRGEVVVAVEVDPRGSGPGSLRFSIADTGIGIPEEKRRTIFEPFEQADGSTTRKYGGTGLGLSISSKLVGLMGGRIWIEGEIGRGSVFLFNAELGRDVDGEADQIEGSGGAPPIAGLRVLVIDDNRTNRGILEEMLGHWGACPSMAVDGPSALARLREAAAEGRPFDVALIDEWMPGLDGSDLAGSIRDDPELSPTSLALLTSSGGGDHIRAFGVACLSKPVRQSELLGLLARVRGGGDAPTAERHRPASVEGKGPRGDGTAGRPLRILVADDHVVNQKVAACMLEGMGHATTVVGDGRAALLAWQEGRYDLLLLDVQMPEMDGFETVAAIRALERDSGDHVPIVALTAHAMKGDRERCLDAGFDSYASKPIRSDELRAAIERLIGPDVEIEAEAEKDRPVDDAHSPTPGEFDPELALECVGGDSDLLAEVMQLFFDDCPRFLTDMDEAIGRSDAPALKRLGHTVRGVAGNFAMTAVVDAAARLETMGQAEEFALARAALGDLRDAIERVRPALDLVALAGCKTA